MLMTRWTSQRAFRARALACSDPVGHGDHRLNRWGRNLRSPTGGVAV